MSTHPADSVRKASSNNFNRQVGLYSLAAAVAGVSMLALAQPAQSEVVITKKTIPLPESTYLDINNDGINDFAFNNYFSFGSADLAVRGAIPGKGGAFVLGPAGYASPLMRGANIGPSARFSPSSSYAVLEKGSHVGYPNEKLFGSWGGNPKDRYLGFRFRIDGKIHYGWIRLTMFTEPAGAWGATITGYAYETIPNKKIVAGSTKSSASDDVQRQNVPVRASGPALGMLALGAEGLSLWRREETLTAV